ncbi:RepB family DNA primase [Methylocystis sp. WRRC1]|uniref:DUF5906 domain-containing protein n=1 Tax=Methylocystis sp. WRRC1 TaxID=1732014 RepID=UPI001D133012|nr:DUF5906 domain-containing protein [Methylocystis sp. WRRC1]MCC3247432.1 RepB family DNA primase [Methylocystis sp. WRRC1]
MRKPIMTPTNEEFLRALAGEDWKRVPVSTGDKSWVVYPAERMVGVLTNATANYYCVSIFRESTAGHFVRRAECFDGQFVLVIDDVGTKINLRELLRVIPLPTYVLETSPGNFHYGFILTDGRDARVIAALVDSIISDELINPSLRDPGMVGVTRVVRLPVGANCKPAVMAANGGKPWPHVMHVWEPSRAYSVEQMAEELDVDISPEALARFKGGGHTRKATAAEVGIDPLMKLFDARGMLIDATPNDNGWVAIKCPWAADHSDARDEAGYRPGSGGFQCHHGHCEGKGMNELRAWVEEAFPRAERAAALAGTFGPVNENDPVLQGEIKRAMLRDPGFRAIFGDGDDDDGGHALFTCSDGLPDIPGGAYPPDELLPAISARFALVDREGEVNVVHRDAAGADHVLARGSFESYLANIAVKTQNDNGDEKFFPAAKWWKSHPKRPPIRRAIFDPHRKARIDEYNFWRGFGVAPIQGRDKIKSFLAHLWVVIARRDRRKFRYLIRWLAWSVQNPEKRAETVIVLKSESEGSGKSTVSDAMRVIFGKHAAVVSDSSEVVGNHVDDLEFVSFLQMEEALFAGDPRIADRTKHAITGTSLRINPKGRKAYQAPNRLHAILTTNHSWAVPAGREARRWFVCEVSGEKVGDRAWFDKIYDDLQAGGYGQLLNYLQRKKLGSFHPRNMPRTFELAEQQIRSASTVHQWLLVCAAEGFVAAYDGAARKDHLRLELGAAHPSAHLYAAYTGATKMQGGRVETQDAFCKRLTKILGEDSRVRDIICDNVRHHRGYYLPHGDELARAVERSLGVVERVTDGARECNRRADEDDEDDEGPF